MLLPAPTRRHASISPHLHFNNVVVERVIPTPPAAPPSSRPRWSFSWPTLTHNDEPVPKTVIGGVVGQLSKAKVAPG